MPCHTISYLTLLYYTTLYHIVLYHGMACYTILYHTMQCRANSCYAMPCILYQLFLPRLWGTVTHVQQGLCERQGAPWTGLKSIMLSHKGKHLITLSLTPRNNLEFLINLHYPVILYDTLY